MTGIVLRLAGPLQSWGEHSSFTERDTLRFPTRSGIIGMFAAARGLRRGEPLDRYDPLTLAVRVDRPGELVCDFHTTGGGLTAKATVPTAAGSRRPPGRGTIVTRRWYLTDAVFTVAAEGPPGLIRDIADALRHPHWQPYLGRRSCPPDQPLLLRVTGTDPAADLTTAVPLPGRRTNDADTVTVELITETPGAPGQDAAVTELNDVPVTAPGGDRAYRTRLVYQNRVQVPATLAKHSTADYHAALHDYARSNP